MQSPVKVWRNQKKVAVLLGKTGKIIAWTIVRVPPAGFSDQAPYAVVIVALHDGSRLTAQLIDYKESDISFGTKVVTVIRRITHPDPDGIILYGMKVKPL